MADIIETIDVSGAAPATGAITDDIQIDQQVAIIRAGNHFVNLARAATIGDGIRAVAENDVSPLGRRGHEAIRAGRVMKFVPASGAATRMFDGVLGSIDPTAMDELWNSRAHLALLDGAGFQTRPEFESALIRLLVDDGVANLPKGLVPFHRYDTESRTALEEHLVEAARFFRSDNAIARAHFTVSEDALPLFTEETRAAAARVEKRYATTLEASFSIQNPSTRTIALTDDGSIAKGADGKPLLRPGGHGALLRNLKECRGDLIVIKNIDNVVCEPRLEATGAWNTILAGVLLGAMELAHRDLAALRTDASRETIEHAEEFILMTFGHRMPTSGTLEERRQAAIGRLDRPWRACGMVKNEGEPGGGPFWVKTGDEESLQIIESAQVDLTDTEQKTIWESSTHFNPVHLVCALRDAEGNPYDLINYTDPDQAIVSRKIVAGRTLRILEWPGLWNGAMAKWNTIFVEIPSETFAPVKRLTDLLRGSHLA